jgi:methionine-rich copper-binding protein CopC
MRKTLLLFTTMALALVLVAGMAWAAPGAPTVVSTVPTSGATNVDPTANIKAKFSEAMKESSINTSTFYLLRVSCPAPPVAATVRYNADTKTAILDPTASLATNTEYTAVVEGTGDGDMKALKDRGGTPLASDYTFSFTTGSSSGGGGDFPCA